MADPGKQSTEYNGQGQSGYTAGRVEHDQALELQLEAQKLSLKDDDEPAMDLGVDERFTGVGGLCSPDEEKRRRSE